VNTDIRLPTSFREHRKRKKLIDALGAGAVQYLIDLWLGAAVSCPEGTLTDWARKTSLLRSDGKATPENFVAVLKKTTVMMRQRLVMRVRV
jgi:hypothetical protein